jgi:hypothetical protein
MVAVTRGKRKKASTTTGVGRDTRRTRHDALRIQSQCVALLLADVGLFGNKARLLSDALKKIQESLGLACPPLTTIRDWYRHYQMYGELPIESSRRRRRRQGWKLERKRKFTWTTDELNVVQSLVMENPALFLDEISEEYHRRKPHDKKSDSAIWRCLHDTLNLSLKVVSEIASQRDEEERQEYQQAILDLVHHPNMLLFIDESAKDRNSARRRLIWAEKGKKAELKAPFVSDGFRYTLMGVADINGFVKQACEVILREKSSFSIAPPGDDFAREMATRATPEKTPE